MSGWGRFVAALAALALGASASAAVDAGRAGFLSGSSFAPATPAHSDPGLGAVTIVGTLLLAGAGGWLLWRGRKLPFAGRAARKLAIDETRSLGSRQYLVVASYEGRRMLLGVCPGRIDLLTSLDNPGAPGKAP